MIYQLLRTTPYLSGQIRNDIICNNGVINKLVLAPLCDDIAFNENEKRPVLNYTHTDNIKYMYNILGDDFYTNTSKYVGEKYIFNNGVLLDTYDNTYMAGPRRVNRYKRYNKQFSFLIPLWISEQIDFKNVAFKVSLHGYKSKFNIIEKHIKFSDEITQYYNEYFSVINDDLLNINIDNNQAFISGIDVKSGRDSIYDISYILPNILRRERPLLETDYIFTSAFKDSHIISKQLINFNLVFNFMDITTQDVINELIGKDICINIETIYNNKIISIKDFYTNYEFIPAAILSGDNVSYSQSHNVLEYLNDYNNIDANYENKLTQPVFHWALLENKDVSFNLYDGYAPSTYIDNELYRICGHYGSQGDLSLSKYNVFDNNISWCDFNDCSSLSAFDVKQKLLETDDTYTNIAINNPIIWFNSNKYDISLHYNDIKNDVNIIQIKTVLTSSRPNIEDFLICIYQSSDVQILFWEDYKTYKFIVLSSSRDNLTIMALQALTGIDPQYERQWSILMRIFAGYVKPYKIEFFKTLQPKSVPIIDNITSLKEIEYYKVDKNCYSFIYRYFGKMIPHFIDIDNDIMYNFIYNYQQWYDVNTQYMKTYNRLLKLGYNPKYPSIKLDDEHVFYALLKERYSSSHPRFYNEWDWEIPHAIDNKLFIMPEKIEYSIELPVSLSNDEISDEIIDALYNKFKDYGFTKTAFLNHILNLYEKTINFDYKSNTNISDIIFDVKFELK